MTTKLEVLTVTKLTDIVTGKTAIQVNFGDAIPVDPNMRERFKDAQQQPPVGSEAMHPLVSLMLPPEGIEPYRVGSKWRLERAPSGELTLREEK